MRQPTVLIADDHAIVKEGLVSLLKEHDYDVVSAVADGHELIDAARRLQPDVIVTDLSMPGLSGLDVLNRLKAEHIISKVIVLTMHRDGDLAARALRAGASAFLLKHSAGDELLTAIHQALEGRVYLTPALTKEVIERMAGSLDRAEPQLTREATGCAAPRPRRTADEGDRGEPGAVRADSRDPQVSDDADPRRELDGRTRQVRDRASADRRTDGRLSLRADSVIFRSRAQ